eukprot:6338012-Ditylum_brightwellii.AAC.1
MHCDQEKGCPCKDYPISKTKRNYMPLPLVGPLNFLNHACAKHCNMTMKCVSGKRYKCTLNRVVKKGGQGLINYYFDEEDVEGEDELDCTICSKKK